ncbi:Lrp/AsnC family transcriptional regulator [Promicromonospora sukumoe]
MVLTSASRRSSGAEPTPDVVLDDVDRAILEMLLRDGRATLRELSAATGLSTSGTSVRARRLLEQGVIAGFHARIDLAAVGRPLEFLVHVQIDSDTDLGAFEDMLTGTASVVSAWQAAGEFDYAIHLACRSPQDVEAELHHLREQPGVRHASAHLLLHRVPTWSGAA